MMIYISLLFHSTDWFKRKNYRKPLIFPWNMGISCECSLKSISFRRLPLSAGLELGTMLWNGGIANGFCVIQVNTSRLTASETEDAPYWGLQVGHFLGTVACKYGWKILKNEHHNVSYLRTNSTISVWNHKPGNVSGLHELRVKYKVEPHCHDYGRY